MQAIEIKDYQILIDLTKSKSNIKIKPIQIKYITLNQNYLYDIITSDSLHKQAIENHRLIPKIDDNGNINGSILLFNHK